MCNCVCKLLKVESCLYNNFFLNTIIFCVYPQICGFVIDSEVALSEIYHGRVSGICRNGWWGGVGWGLRTGEEEKTRKTVYSKFPVWNGANKYHWWGSCKMPLKYVHDLKVESMTCTETKSWPSSFPWTKGKEKSWSCSGHMDDEPNAGKLW